MRTFLLWLFLAGVGSYHGLNLTVSRWLAQTVRLLNQGQDEKVLLQGGVGGYRGF